MPDIKIADRTIGADAPPYIIAEISANHNGSIDRALQLIEEAHKTGADAVKLQTFRPDTITLDSQRPEFTIHGGEWDGRQLYDLYQEAHTPWEWHEALFAKGRALGITVFSSPFDATAVDFLETLNCPAYKIASPELIDLPLIAKVASTGKPMIISTGMGSDDEIVEAVVTARNNGAKEIIVLHCISGYPTPVAASNLGNIAHLRDLLDTDIGLSDHTRGTTVAAAAVALGATVIEKHFTLSHEDGGLDAAFSLDSKEFTELVTNAKEIFHSIKNLSDSSENAQKGTRNFRRSLYVTQDIRAGEPFTAENIRSVRPAAGLPPKHYWAVLSGKASRDVKAGEPLDWDMIE